MIFRIIHIVRYFIHFKLIIVAKTEGLDISNKSIKKSLIVGWNLVIIYPVFLIILSTIFLFTDLKVSSKTLFPPNTIYKFSLIAKS